MIIPDDFEIRDEVSGLLIKAIKGTHLNHLHIEKIGEPIADNRDLYFTLEGKFDGTGSGCSENNCVLEEKEGNSP